MASRSFINLKGIKKQYENDSVITKVLHGVDLQIDQGEFLAIMGPSGSGKSTLMNIIGLLDRASQGKYIFKGKDVYEYTEDELASLRNKEIGFIFQSFNLLPKTSVLDNVILPLLYNKKKNKRKIAEDVIESVGLSHRINNLSNQLSGGEKQRVAIARALINNPTIVLADEPTGNLDSKTGQQIMELIQNLNEKGHTILLVTHEQFTAKHADRIVKIKDGTIEKDYIVDDKIIAKNNHELTK